MKNKGLIIFRIVSAILLVCIMIAIFIFSSQNDIKSSQTSGNFILALLKIFYPPFEDFSEIQRTEFIASLQLFVRKGAHFTIYAVLGFFSFLTFITYKKIPFKIRLAIIASFCLLYSISDEIHQLFVPGRVGHILDVCTDFSGSLLSIGILTLFTRIKKFKKFI